MKLSEIPKNIVYGVVFGFMGLIAGIWTADLFHKLILMENVDRVTTVYISLIIIILIVVSASLLGFTKGKKLLE